MANSIESLWAAAQATGGVDQARVTLKAIFLLTALYYVGLVVYRAFFHPLSKVPGPRLAAITSWYEFYYDGWLGGQYLFKIKDLHEKHGPIVRINPHEVHINDVDYYDTIYASGASHPRGKVRFMAVHDDSMFETWDPALHRRRRAAVATSFSKKAIRALEEPLKKIVDSFRAQMAAKQGTGEVVELHNFWNNLTQEVIGQYCFGTDDIAGLRDGRDAEFLGTFDSYPYSHAWSRRFPLLFDLIASLPLGALAAVDPAWLQMRDFMKAITAQVTRVLAMDQPHVGIKNVFHEMRDSKHLPEADKNLGYYSREAVSFIGAGTETTSSALTTMSYHLLLDPEILRKVKKELATVMTVGSDDLPPLATLEALPYLTGVVNESIRLSAGVPGRLPQTAPTETLQYGGFKLPPGTVMSQSSWLISMDERYFPSPRSFAPERWAPEAGGRELQSKLLSFSRGARGCIGMNLAYAEMYLVAAGLFPRIGGSMRLFETALSDIELASDGFIGIRPRDSQGCRVKVVNEDAESDL